LRSSDLTRNGVLGDPDVDPRFESPAMPRAYFGGVKVSF
jgi:hypothetical protein